jgi:hypothetical protein
MTKTLLKAVAIGVFSSFIYDKFLRKYSDKIIG